MNVIPGTIVDGRYLVESLLGSGGMAEVYLARHLTLGSRHAVKLLNTHSPEVRKRLLSEGQVQAALRHENVVTVTDAIEVGKSPALVMEYVRGPHLGWLLAQMQLSVGQADDLARQLFAGIAAAHELGIVHRDLKPANLLLDLRRHRPVLKIADFGLVKVLQTEQGDKTRSGSTFGTPEYMAPEQVRDASRVDPRADLFAIGAILYELVTGRRCFESGDDLYELFQKIVEARYAPVAEVAPDVPARMVAAIGRALEPDRERRVQTVEELRRIWFEGEPPRDDDPWADPTFTGLVELWFSLRDAPPPADPGSPGQLIGVPAAPPAPEPPPSPPSPVEEPLPPPAISAGPRTLPRARTGAAVALALAGLFAVVGLWALVLAGSPDPAPSVRPAEVVVAPPPAPVPAPAPVAPEPAAAPVAAPPPIPVRVAVAPAPPVPAPAPEPVAAPEPASVAVPEPAPVAVAAVGPPRFEVIGADGITLSLRDATGRAVPLTDAGPGRYTLVAFFEPRVPTEHGTLDVAPGSAWTVRCSTTAQRCTAKASR